MTTSSLSELTIDRTKTIIQQYFQDTWYGHVAVFIFRDLDSHPRLRIITLQNLRAMLNHSYLDQNLSRDEYIVVITSSIVKSTLLKIWSLTRGPKCFLYRNCRRLAVAY